MLTIQTDNRFMNTVHNGFKKLLCRKNIVQRTGTIFSQALSHTVEAIGHLAEFLVSAHIQTFLIVMISDFKDTTRQFLDRLVDGTGKPDQQHDTGKSSFFTDPSQYKTENKCINSLNPVHVKDSEENRLHQVGSQSQIVASDQTYGDGRGKPVLHRTVPELRHR